MRELLTWLLRAKLARFALTGTLVAALYFSVTTALTLLVGAPTQLAVVVGYVLAVALHFTMNRRFVFASTTGYAHHLTAQGSRYLVVVLSSYACTALVVALADRAGLPELIAALGTPVAFAALSFFTLRGWVFRSAGDPPSAGSETAGVE
jgi:putative flippase GtrA